MSSPRFLEPEGDAVSCLKLQTLKSNSLALKLSRIEGLIRTVTKAYEKLVEGWLAVQQHGRGVFVTDPQSTLPARRRRVVLTEHIRRLMSEAKRLGADPEEVIAIVEQVASQLENTK